MAATLEPQQQQRSLRYLRLQHDFRAMLTTGMDVIDEREFAALLQGRVAPHQAALTWRALQRQCESVVAESCAELEVACSEVGLQQQLEELEALCLQRGLLGGGGGGSGASDPAGLPAAVEAATRMAVKRAEKQQLLAALQELSRVQESLTGELAAKQAQAGELVADFKAVEDQVDKVYQASKHWPLQPPSDTSAAAP